jgi:diacylglycerol kinase family enzyme
MKILVLLNESSRRLVSAPAERKDVSVNLLRAFADAGAKAFVHCIDAPALLRQAKEAAHSDMDAIVVGGGDGLFAEVVNLLAASYKAVGVLPLGNHNHFARWLKVPQELDRAAAALARGRVSEIPLPEINGRIFLNFAAVGLPGESTPAPRESWPAMLRRVVGMNDRCMRVRSRGHTFASDAISVIVCNNPEAMEVFAIPASRAPEGGLLNVYVARPSRPHGPIARVFSAIGARIWNGATPRYETMALPEVRIESSRRVLEVSIDGDVWSMRPPLHCGLRQRPVRVLAPADGASLPAAPRNIIAESTTTTTTTAAAPPDGLELEPNPPDTTLQP